MIKKKVTSKKTVKRAVKRKILATTKKKVPVKKKVTSKKTVKRAVKKKISAKSIVPKKLTIEELELLDDMISRLIKKGRSRGFITETEVLYAMPEIECCLESYVILLERMEENSIDLIEEEISLLGKPKDDKTANTKTKRIDLTDISSDSIQMYLREIGKVPLLKSDEELQLAKRKEKKRSRSFSTAD